MSTGPSDSNKSKIGVSVFLLFDGSHNRMVFLGCAGHCHYQVTGTTITSFSVDSAAIRIEFGYAVLYFTTLQTATGRAIDLETFQRTVSSIFYLFLWSRHGHARLVALWCVQQL